MKKLLLILCGVLALDSTAHAASDDGILIAGMGFTNQAMRSYTMHYKRQGERESWPFPDPYIMYSAQGWSEPRSEFKGHETGEVEVKRLKPGNYEFYTINILGPWSYYGDVRIESPQPFSVPFTIRPGEATYVGDFTFVLPFIAGVGPGEGGTKPVGGYIVLSDQHERDIPIAQKKMPNLGTVTIAVPDASTLGTAFIRAKEGP